VSDWLFGLLRTWIAVLGQSVEGVLITQTRSAIRLLPCRTTRKAPWMLHIKNKSVLETQLYETNVGWTVEVIGSDHGVMRPIMLFDTAVPISEARCEFDAAVVSVLVPA
jgi:hypothetical protein